MEYDLQLRDYWRVLRKRRAIILLTAVILAAFVAVMATLRQPTPVYESSATLKIEKSSTTTGLYLEALSWSGADFLETQASIITSYPVIEETAKQMGVIAADLDQEQIRTDRELIGHVLELKEKVSAEREGDSNLVNITARDSQPKVAQEIANTVARVFTAEHTAKLNRRTFESRSFIEQQLDEVAAKLRESEEKVKEYRERHTLISLNGQTSTLLSKAAEAEADKIAIDKSMAELRFMADRLSPEKNSSITTKDSFFISQASPLYMNLNDKLVSLLIEKDSLLLLFTDQHPKVIDINNQIQEIATNMRAQLLDRLNGLEQAGSRTAAYLEQVQEQLSAMPEKGLTLARLERQVKFNEKIYALLESKLQEAKIMEAAKVEEVYVVKPALEPQEPINSSQVAFKTLAGLVIGLLIGAILAFIVETFDTSIATIREAEEYAGVNVLGVIPAVSAKELQQSVGGDNGEQDLPEEQLHKLGCLVSHFIPKSLAAENFRTIRTNIQFTAPGRALKTIAFTSSVPGEGKTTSLINTAITMAQSQNKVLLLEADLRKPVISKCFGLEPAPGLTDVIIGSQQWQEAVKSIVDLMLGELDVDEVMHTPGLDYLNIMTAGDLPVNPGELMTSENFLSFLEMAKQEYDYICIDIPPVLSVADASIVSPKVDGVVVVYKVGSTARDSLGRSLDQLKHVGANVIGLVLNDMNSKLGREYQSFVQDKAYGLASS